MERWAGRLARRRTFTVLLMGAAAPLLRLLMLPIVPIPEPARHDEFSHLLASEAFAAGGLTNPTHPMWRHFETFHVDWTRTYMSMYFPGQGLVLAVGRVLFGHPWFGVCLSVGLMCGAIGWMLQAWLPPGWALLGGVLVSASHRNLPLLGEQLLGRRAGGDRWGAAFGLLPSPAAP